MAHTEGLGPWLRGGLSAPQAPLTPPLYLFVPSSCSPATGIEPGHIPGTVNIPFVDFLTSEGLEKSPEDIRRLFQDKRVDLAQPLVATCGSGVTACHVALGAYLCGKADVAIYDGSWVEWYMRAQPEEVISEGRGKTRGRARRDSGDA